MKEQAQPLRTTSKAKAVSGWSLSPRLFAKYRNFVGVAGAAAQETRPSLG
jgi:hypothetical protein